MKFKLSHVTDTDTDWISRIYDIVEPENIVEAGELIGDLSAAITDAETDWITAIMFWVFGFCTAFVIFV